jgi:uncharacterized protein (DUF111 family)
MDSDKILTIRTPSGLSGDMMLAGLASLSMDGHAFLRRQIVALGLESLSSAEISLTTEFVSHIRGVRLKIHLPHEHHHRDLAAISRIIEQSGLSQLAQDKALAAFELLARAEGEVHGKDYREVHFHEVGALDSILDICVSCALLAELSVERLVCSPLPVADGEIDMAHGKLFSPAPAVLNMLQGVPVYGVPPEGETVTPTALALLKAWGFDFGPWPAMTVERSQIVYGGKRFAHVPNGALFVLGYEEEEPFEGPDELEGRPFLV